MPEADTYNVTAFFESSSQFLFETKTVAVPGSGTTLPFTSELKPQGVTGRVVDANGLGVPGASVAVLNAPHTTQTTANGTFGIETPSGQVELVANAPGFEPATVNVSVASLSVTRGVVIQLDQLTGVPVSGTVVDFSGNPINDADIFLSANSTQTVPDGTYSIAAPASAAGSSITVTAATAVDSETRLITLPPGGATGVDFVLGTASDPDPAGNLEIRFENTGELVNNRTVTVTFFDDSQEQVAIRNTTTGLVSLQSLTDPPPLVAVGEAPGLFSRRIILDNLDGGTLFLLDDDKASNEVVVQEFDIRDNTGRFTGPDTRFSISRAVALPGERDDIPLRVLASDLLGANERFGIALESDVRYRIQVESGDGDVRDLGPHVVTSSGVVAIEIGEIQFERDDRSTFEVGANAKVQDGTGSGDGQPITEITFNYLDPSNATRAVEVRIYNRSNESQELVNKVFTPTSGTFGNLTVRELVVGEQAAETEWTVEYRALRNDTEPVAGEITVTARTEDLDIPLSQGLQQLLGIGMIFIIGGLFSRRNAAVGAVVVPALAGALFLFGFLSGVVTGAAVAFALTVGVGYNFATRGA